MWFLDSEFVPNKIYSLSGWNSQVKDGDNKSCDIIKSYKKGILSFHISYSSSKVDYSDI